MSDGQVIRIPKWDEFQHYKDRSPPWIKLHRSLLDNREWHMISAEASKVLIELWLVAADSGSNGVVGSSVKDIAFRIRRSETDLYEYVDELEEYGFVERLDPEDVPDEEEWPSRYIPKDVREEVWDRDDGKCVNSECESPRENVEFDHVVPVSKGGESVASNLQLLCRSCNRRKRVRSKRYEPRSRRYAEKNLRSPETETEGEGETEGESFTPPRDAPEGKAYENLVDWIGEPGPVDGFLSADPNNEKALASIYRLYATKSMTGEQTWNGLDPPDRKRIVADALEAMAGEGQKYNAKFFRRIIQDRVREHGTGGSAANGTNGRRDSGSSGRKAPGDGNGANGFGDLEGQFHIETHEVD